MGNPGMHPGCPLATTRRRLYSLVASKSSPTNIIALLKALYLQVEGSAGPCSGIYRNKWKETMPGAPPPVSGGSRLNNLTRGVGIVIRAPSARRITT